MRYVLGLAVVGLCFTPCNPAAASEYVIEEVVVTATKRESSLHDIPLSVSALSGEKIEDAGIDKLEDLSAYIPNFNMTESAIGNIVFIRGVGSGINQGFEQSVGMFIDGIYVGRSQQYRAPFLDLERVEVLRGPQGTLFGKNTVAGALNITTAKPTQEFEAEISARYEPDHGEQEYTAIVSGPLSEALAARLALSSSSMDGYLKNVINGKDEAERDEFTARLTVDWTPLDRLQITTKLETGTFDVTGRSIQVGTANGTFRGVNLGDAIATRFGPVEDGEINTRKASRGFLPEKTDTEYDLFSVTAQYDIGEYTLTSVTGYSTYEFDELTDADFTALALLDNRFEQDFDQFSQELRLTSPLGERFEYIAGLYYQTNSLDSLNTLLVNFAEAGIAAPGFYRLRQFEQDADTFAAFFEGTAHLGERLHLTLGLRWTQEEKDVLQSLAAAAFGSTVPNPAFDGLMGAFGLGVSHRYDEDRTERNVTPTLNVQYDVGEDTMIYARATRGYKSGGFNEAENSGDLSRFEFEDEQATSFEVGTKLRLLENTASLNIAVFYTDYQDRQVSAFDGTSFVVGNAAESTSKGIELDGSWRATERLTLGLSVAYLESEFDSFRGAGCTAAQTAASTGACTQDLSGRETEFAPDVTASLSAEYIWPVTDHVEMVFQVDGNYSGDYYFAQDLDPFESQDAYTKWNARIGIGAIDGRWELTLLGKNLTDEDVLSHGNDIPLFNGAHFSFVERPRTVALEGRLRF